MPAPPPDAPQGSERLQKVLARAGIASRRTSEALIVGGRVQVNGVTVTALGTKVDVARDAIRVDGSPLPISDDVRQTWAVHKPRGLVTTMRDPQGRPTVRTLVADLPLRLYPVGRLDWDAEGLLLMSNDGELTHQLTHPRFGVPRSYHALVKGRVDPATLDKLRSPLELEDGPVQTLAVEILAQHAQLTELRVDVAEGRNHLVKRLFEAVGHEVERLRREAYGGVTLGSLPAGGRRRLTPAELERLRAAIRSEP